MQKNPYENYLFDNGAQSDRPNNKPNSLQIA